MSTPVMEAQCWADALDLDIRVVAGKRGSSEMTPSKSTAIKWAALENATRKGKR
jgi:hypothetical protein